MLGRRCCTREAELEAVVIRSDDGRSLKVKF